VIAIGELLLIAVFGALIVTPAILVPVLVIRARRKKKVDRTDEVDEVNEVDS
jgi:hypothetical protein